MVAIQPIPSRPTTPVPLSRTWRIGATEVVVVLVANGVLILARRTLRLLRLGPDSQKA
jgi:hypothetical protein